MGDLLDRMAAAAVTDPPPLSGHVRQRLIALLSKRVQERLPRRSVAAGRKAA